MYCSLHPLGGCFLYATGIISMNLIEYNVDIRCFIINICVIQTMDNFQEFSFKSVLMPEHCVKQRTGKVLCRVVTHHPFRCM